MINQARGGLPVPLRQPSARVMRQRLEDALERLLSAAEAIVADLDQLEGDPDLEEQCEDEGAEHDGREPDVDDEASLGWTCAASICQLPGVMRSGDRLITDGEKQCEDEGGACEDEGWDSDSEVAEAICPRFFEEGGRQARPPVGARS